MDASERIYTELSNLSEWVRSLQMNMRLHRGDSAEKQKLLTIDLEACGTSWPAVRARMDRALQKAGLLSKRTAGRPTVPVEREQVLKRLNANKKKIGKPNVGEVANHFGISRQTVYRMIESVRMRIAEVNDELAKRRFWNARDTSTIALFQSTEAFRCPRRFTPVERSARTHFVGRPSLSVSS